eukprot:4564607-Prymnesium_polylepis.1
MNRAWHRKERKRWLFLKAAKRTSPGIASANATDRRCQQYSHCSGYVGICKHCVELTWPKMALARNELVVLVAER